jgi:hypothetical protein
VNSAYNTSGQAYALTVLTPIARGQESALARRLDALGTAAASPLAAVPGTHFARWVVLGDVVYEGPPQTRDHLRLPRLLFTSNFDGPLDPYLEALRTGLGEQADAIWGACVGYPGSKDAGSFAGYMRRYQIGSSMFYAAYGQRTVQDVTRSLDLRRRLMTFALDHQGEAAAELQQAFARTFPA